jgi:hypothetical protein
MYSQDCRKDIWLNSVDQLRTQSRYAEDSGVHTTSGIDNRKSEREEDNMYDQLCGKQSCKLQDQVSFFTAICWPKNTPPSMQL